MADSAAHDEGASRASVADLPEEILVQIFSHLSFSDLVDVVQKVCSRWKSVSQDLALWTDKELQISRRNARMFKMDGNEVYPPTVKVCLTDQEAIQTLCDVPSLRKVNMERGATFRVFHALCDGCPRLSELRLGNQTLSYSVLKNLVEKCSGIHTLEINVNQLKTEKFSELVSHLQHLRVLVVDSYYPSETKPVLKPLGDGCPQLEELDLGVNVEMDDLRYFLNAKRNTLKSIHINWSVLPLLVVCADTLECLELYYYDVMGNEAMQAFTALGSLKKLRELRMRDYDARARRAAARVFDTGVGLPHLTLLHLEGHGLDNDTILAISHGCPALRELAIADARRLTDAAFSQIYRLEHLKRLEISCCKRLGGALIPYLARLTWLLTLVFDDMEFPKLQPGLGSILDFSGLRCLTLEYCLVTGVPFDKFPEKLVSLRELNYEHCRGDPKATDGLAERMPGVKICGNFEEDEEESEDDQEQGDAQQGEGQNEENEEVWEEENEEVVLEEENAELVWEEVSLGPGDSDEEDWGDFGPCVQPDRVPEILDGGTLSLLFLEDT